MVMTRPTKFLFVGGVKDGDIETLTEFPDFGIKALVPQTRHAYRDYSNPETIPVEHDYVKTHAYEVRKFAIGKHDIPVLVLDAMSTAEVEDRIYQLFMKFLEGKNANED